MRGAIAEMCKCCGRQDVESSRAAGAGLLIGEGPSAAEFATVKRWRGLFRSTKNSEVVLKIRTVL
jgi:hypothetical protein